MFLKNVSGSYLDHSSFNNCNDLVEKSQLH